MKLRSASLPSEMTWPPQGTAVVIDVLRATSVITQALHAGATEVVVCGEISDAFQLADRAQPRPLLCGERACKPIEGFDLGNSPSEYSRARVGGKTLVMTTTNGTRAVLAAAGFERIYAACFNNLSAVVARLQGQPEVSLICAGTDGEPTEEDLLLAGAILHALLESPIAPRPKSRSATAAPQPAASADAIAASLGPSETAALQLWQAHLASGQTLATRLRQTLGGRNLVTAGYERDIDVCAAIDTTDVVPTIEGRDKVTFRKSPR